MLKIAIANLTTAPYGKAAREALTKLDLWKEVEPKVVIGDNITQTSQFVETGNADIGDYTYLSSTSFEPEYLSKPGYIIQSFGNKDLTWEKNLQWNAGLDFSLWKNRLRGSPPRNCDRKPSTRWESIRGLT